MKNLSVIKFGGSLTKNFAAQNKFLKGLAALSKKENIILVHGGGPEINLYLSQFGIKSKFVNGLRYTDAQTLKIAESALSGKVNKSLVGALLKNGVKAVGISGKDGGSVLCKQKKELGFVGEPIKVNKKLISLLLNNNFLPVISPISISQKGFSLNVNADSLASVIAAAFKSAKLIFLTDTAGVLDKNKKTIKQIKVKNIDALIKDGTITGGMLPKIKACAQCVKKGVKEVWIADGISGIKNLKGTVITK
ncbi:MAG: acetylglutamate kinase [Elusimicrobiota bacterium]|jgi:acetylglutamate kinase|nr:acetylglutamate kinase [Elusimicrobiota bacterium]